MNPFPVEWDQLTRQDVEAFLADAGREPLTWEAKGGGEEPSKKALRKSLAGFANSRIGGCYILGADEVAGGVWQVTGVPLPGRETEPEKWIDQAARQGLRPCPSFRVHSWPLGTGRWLLVIRVEPMAGLCLTADGVAYQRLSGRTEPIADPTILADLYRRGEAAMARAEQRATSNLTAAFNDGPLGGRRLADEVRIGLGLASVGLEDDIGRRLFSTRLEAEMLGAAADDLGVPADHPFEGPLGAADVEMSARHVTFHRRTRSMPHYQESWVIRGTWEGAAVAMWTLHDSDEALIRSVVDNKISRLWRAAERIVSTLGGYGDSFLALQIDAASKPISRDHVALIPDPITRWVDAQAPHEAVLASVQREIRRHRGTKVFED